MAKKQRKFADDGWAIWISGEDVSTVYINDWLNPKGQSYVDLAIRICGVKGSKSLHVYIPFFVTKEEIEDVSLLFEDKRIVQAIFSTACIIEYKKNEKTSEIAYNGKTVDIVHISSCEFELSPLSEGTLINVDLEKLHDYLDNDEAYLIWRMPHKSLNEIFLSRSDMGSKIEKLRDLITTPVVTEKYGYSIRINESRVLPAEINKIGTFHSQKLKKAVVTISINESYELNDVSCYRVRRLEENLYKEFLPESYKCEDVISYQWNQNREENFKGCFNFYFNIAKNSVSRLSMFLYLVLLTIIGIIGNLFADLIGKLMGL